MDPLVQFVRAIVSDFGRIIVKCLDYYFKHKANLKPLSENKSKF